MTKNWNFFVGEIEPDRHKLRAERLTIVYLLYQILIFSSVSGVLPGGAALLYWWVPLVFSFTLSVVYFSCFLPAVVAFHRAQHELDQTRMERIRILTENQKNQIQSPIFFGKAKTPEEEVRYRTTKRRVVLGVVVGLLVGFSVVMLLGCWLVSPAEGGSLSGAGSY